MAPRYLPPNCLPTLLAVVLKQIAYVSFVTGSTMVLSPAPITAQVTPDDTLGAEQSQVIENFLGLPIEIIDGGTQRGSNLFHSFEEFNVDEDRAAFFFSPDDINNIFSRVTGNNRSEILGTLGTFGGNADLFLMNPNGIIFGPNSIIDVEGSFAAVTANGIQFGEQDLFSASNPETPSQLLTVDPSAFFFNQIPAGNIVSRSRVQIDGETIRGLSVPDGENLLLLGGNITVDGGYLGALGGRIDVGAIGGTGSVGFNPDGSLSFPESLVQSDVVFANFTLADASLDDGGDITVIGQNITLLDSGLQTGLREGLGNADSQAGTILLDARDSVQLIGAAFISNSVASEATGSGGNIEINATTL